MNLEGKRVLVVGSGKSGVAAAELLRKKGITFVLFDGNKDLDVTALIEKNPVFAGAEILLGRQTFQWSMNFETDRFQSGAKSNLPIILQKEELLQLPEQTEKLRQLRLWVRSWRIISMM